MKIDNTYQVMMSTLFNKINEDATFSYRQVKHPFLEVTNKQAISSIATLPTDNLNLSIVEYMMQKDVKVLRGLTVKGDHYREHFRFSKNGNLKYRLHDYSNALQAEQKKYAKNAIVNILANNLANRKEQEQEQEM